MSSKAQKEIIKYAKKLNKLELTDSPIELDSDFDDLKEDFISAIEEIDDDGNIDEVDEKTIDFYENLLEDSDTPDNSSDEKEKESGSFDEDDVREELEDMSVKEMKKYIEENELDIETKVKKNTLDEVIEEVIEALSEAAGNDEKEVKKKGKKEKKGKKGKKGKKTSSLRSGTLPAKILEKIEEEDGEITWLELAEFCAEEKDKEPSQCMGIALRTISRKVSKAVPICLVMEGDDDSAVFKIMDD